MENQIAELEATITDQKALVERLRKALFAKAKDRTAHEFTARISQVMQRMISDVTQEKFHQIESLALEMFNKIIRKENFVQLIELDDNFNVNLYKKQIYTTHELLLLANNIGLDALENDWEVQDSKRLPTFNKRFYRRTAPVFSGKIVTDQISFQDDIELSLYNRVELNQLSKGENRFYSLPVLGNHQDLQPGSSLHHRYSLCPYRYRTSRTDFCLVLPQHQRSGYHPFYRRRSGRLVSCYHSTAYCARVSAWVQRRTGLHLCTTGLFQGGKGMIFKLKTSKKRRKF